MECPTIEELLSPYLEDELNREDRNKVKEHLKTCSSCTSLLSFIKEAHESLVDFPETEVSESLLNRLYNIPEKKKKFKLSFDFFVRSSFQPILAAATIVLTFFSFYFFNPDKNQIDKSINRQVHLGYSKVEKLYAQAESFTGSLVAYKDNILVSLKNTKLFGEAEE